MADLLDTIQRLEETHAEILRVEKAMAQHPDPGLSLILGSLHKRQQHLDQIFGQLTNKLFLDVCDYRLITNSEQRPAISAISRFLGDFQTLFSTVFDALVNGPKERVRIAPEVAAESSFHFGYSYVGSVGFTLTMPNDRLLVGETVLDNTMHTIFQITEAKDSSEISTYAKKVGVAGVRQVYKWADDHVKTGFDADIKWRRENEVRAHRVIQVPELERLQEAINRTSDEREEIITLLGRLVGADIVSKTFHMEFDDGADIKGKMSNAIGHEYTINLPHMYTATFIKTTKVFYSTEREDIDFFLTSLE